MPAVTIPFCAGSVKVFASERQTTYTGHNSAFRAAFGDAYYYDFETAMTDGARVRVLFCEDEPIIRMTSVDMLEEAGMTVLEAGSAKEALEHLALSQVDILVTDIGLPGISGLELAFETRKSLPELPIIFATGDRAVNGAEALNKMMILGKPYTEEELIGAIRRLTS